MPSTLDLSAQETEIFLRKMVDLTNRLEIIGRTPISSAADAERLRAESKALIAAARTDLKQWTGKDLSKLYRDGYLADAPAGTVMSKAARDESYRHRRRFNRNGSSALADLDAWTGKALAQNKDFSDLTRLRRIIKTNEANIAGGGLSIPQKRDLMAQTKQARELEAQGSARYKKSGGSERPEVLYRRRRRGTGQAKGTVFSRRPADEYFNMLAVTAQRDIKNSAFIRGQMERGLEWFIVSDGPECGWTSHEDPDKANGKIVSGKNLVMSAHPYCQREFAVAPDGPRGGKTREVLKALTGAANKQNLTTLAKGAAIFGQASAAATVLSQSPLLRTAVRSIIADQEIALGDWSKKILSDWVNSYGQTEARALVLAGQADNELSRRQLRSEVMEGVERQLTSDDVLNGNSLTKIRLTRREANVLRIVQDTTRGQLISKFEDYADYVRHQTDVSAGALRSVGAAAQDEEVVAHLYQEYAMRYRAIQLGRGSRLFSNARRMEGVIKQAMLERPERAQIEFFRTVVQAYDPLPWLRASVGDFRFSIGMPAHHRADLAEELYIKLRGTDFRNRLDAQYANRIGEELARRNISASDIYRILQPRISYAVNPLHVAVSLENGNLIPAIRLYPGNTYLRQLSLQARLRSGALNDLISRAREIAPKDIPAWLTKELPKLGDDVIWSIDAFRNSPITASARFQALDLESFAVRMEPDSDVLHYTYRIWPRFNPNYSRMSTDRIKEQMKFRGLNIRDGERRAEMIDRLTALGPYSKKESSLVMLPKQFGGGTITNSEADVMRIITGLAHVKGGFIEVSRALGTEYVSMMREVRAWLDLQNTNMTYVLDSIKRFKETFPETQLAKIRSVDDLKKIVEDFKVRDLKAPLRTNYAADTDILVDYLGEEVDPRIMDSFVNKGFRQDLSSMIKFWNDHAGMFGRGLGQEAPLPLFKVVASSDLRGNIMQYKPGLSLSESGKMAVGWENILNYEDLVKEMKHLKTIGYSASDSPLGVIAHEMGHHWSTFTASPARLSRYWDEVIRNGPIQWEIDPPDVKGLGSNLDIFLSVQKWMENPNITRQITHHISSYASTNSAELFAELFSETLVSENPRALAVASRKFFGL